MMVQNEAVVKKLVGMLIEVLHGEYSDTRDLAVIQLAMFGEKAVPYISSYLKDEETKENDMIRYFETYMKWKEQDRKSSEDEREYRSIYIQAWDSERAKEKIKKQEIWEKSSQETRKLETEWTTFAKSLMGKYHINDTYFDSLSDESPQYFAEKIERECGGPQRRRAIEGAFKALSIIGDKKAIPLLEHLPMYQFPYENQEDEDQTLKPVFEKAKEAIELIKNGNCER